MNAVEALHVGWLVADLVLAALLLAEIGYLVWRKRRSKKNYSATYSVAPLGLLAAASGAGLTTGIVFFVLLLVSVLFLGVWIADRIIREHGKKSPFAPVTDRGDRIVARLAHKARSCTADDTAELSRPDAIAVAESDEKQLEAQVELGDTEEDIETHIVQLSDKKVSVRYNFSFQAKLIQAPAEVQRRYGLLTELLGQYSLLNSVQSWKQLCYYVRRQSRCVVRVPRQNAVYCVAARTAEICGNKVPRAGRFGKKRVCKDASDAETHLRQKDEIRGGTVAGTAVRLCEK